MHDTLTAPATEFATVIVQDALGKRKSDRTRASLMAATCELLSEITPDKLKVSDICAKAGVAHGTFYVYFPDISALLETLLRAFVSHMQRAMHIIAKSTPGDRIRATNALYVALFEHNPGLMRCLVSSFDIFPEAAACFQSLNRAWAETVAEAASRKLERSGQFVPKDELLRRAYALGGMVDQYLVTLHFNRDTSLAALSHDRAAVVETLTFIWDRGMGI